MGLQARGWGKLAPRRCHLPIRRLGPPLTFWVQVRMPSTLLPSLCPKLQALLTTLHHHGLVEVAEIVAVFVKQKSENCAMLSNMQRFMVHVVAWPSLEDCPL